MSIIEVVERKKRLNTRLIFGLLVIGVFIAITFPTFGNELNKFFVQKTKKESTVTKTLTKDEIAQLHEQQLYGLTYKYDKWNTKWLSNEIRDGAYTVFKMDLFMSNQPEYDSAKIKFNVTKYKVDGKIVEFMSNSKITQVHSKSGWKDK
ncbi:hypothetical protein J5Y03_17070 [Bacillus sp. RG28]|uniref:Uncharacterized protein n=1 Tax=Gottfriedia endophytica TaxID=2820819 RepID=A0A940SKW4_9BACI|nr:hypothetical protein [Gottfriedia endophytica]MBP0726871.1 hypothetical protein [Gottfriedia endophytica]